MGDADEVSQFTRNEYIVVRCIQGQQREQITLEVMIVQYNTETLNFETIRNDNEKGRGKIDQRCVDDGCGGGIERRVSLERAKWENLKLKAAPIRDCSDRLRTRRVYVHKNSVN